jgi:ribulose-phosphate 3-epimerase
MVEIIPSILTSDPNELRALISRCEDVVERVSIDIIDPKFAANKTIDPTVFSAIDTNLKLDFHLMVIEPVNWIEKCVSAGADRIIGHIEHMTSQTEFVGKVQEVGAQIGLGLDLETPVDKLDPLILTNLDVVLVMSVPAGFGGQEFSPKVITKIEKLDKIRKRDTTPYKIHDDGGITFDRIDDVRLAGVDEVSIGRRLFDGDISQNIEKFTKAAYKK